MRLLSQIARLLLAVLGTAVVIGIVLAIAATAPPNWRTAAMLTLYAAAAALILVLVGRKRWVLPLRHLESAAQRMARGEWDVRVQPHGSGAMRHMAGDLNLLAAQAYRQLSGLQQQRGDLQALVDALPDPILAVGPAGRLTLMNAPAAKLFSLEPRQALEQKLVSVVSDEQIVELYEALVGGSAMAAEKPRLLHREIRLVRGGQRCIYQAVATRAPGGGALLVLRDVSTLADAAQMKTDFAANASHELRTPVAAIKIAFETLREVYKEDPVQSEKCIAVVDGHLRRLEEMLRDLLDLSRVESADIQLRVVAVKTSELFSVLRSALASVARQKNVELRLCEGDPAEIRTDSRLINLILKNLVENSIKFTPAGGRVVVSIHQTSPGDQGEGRTIISVADTGIGIAPEHLDRVFERFYQVDSARSGSAGRGTGLGLAIVKHAVHALGGVVTLQSTVGEGTTVTCEFPRPVQPAPQQDIQPAVA